MKKVILGIVIIIIILFAFSKIHTFAIVTKMYTAIENFGKLDNKLYKVQVLHGEEVIRKDELFTKEKVLKYIVYKKDSDIYYEWKNLETNESYAVNEDKKKMYKNSTTMVNAENILPHMSHFVLSVYKDEKINLKSIFDVKYIIPTKYNDRSSYKIVTKNETVIVDKNTYLPIYSALRKVNTQKEFDGQVEYIYEFEIENVSDEDVKLPDFSEYTLMDDK